MRFTTLLCCIFVLASCSKKEGNAPTTEEASSPPKTEKHDVVKPKATPALNQKLNDVLAAQDEETKKRYIYRHPYQTLQFFGVEPGMTVVEVLPGGGWYTNILAPYLGSEGALIGVDYPVEIWSNFSFATPEFIEKRESWPDTWPSEMSEKVGEGAAKMSAYTFATLPEELTGKADMVLYIRALHNLSRFNSKGNFLTQAISETHRVLKPGGLVGIVQHEAPEGNTDEWADGSAGYLKKSKIVAMFTSQGFELVESSTINENPKDVPGAEDIVWRLPPSLSTSKEDPELKAKMEAIGESNRMTLLFKKV